MFVRNYVGSLWWRLAAGLLVSIFAAPPAQAQSFFQNLFGFGSPKPAVAAKPSPTKRSYSNGAGFQVRSFKRWMTENHQSTRADSDDYVRDPAFGGSYRTVCVRLCDGYYWPVSRSVSRERFAADSRRCESSCAGEAKLYYQHRDSVDPKSMIDLKGNGYGQLKTAFLYRKTLINGCGCRPAPWSVAETYRHHQYAAADAAKKLQAEMQRQRQIAEALRKDKIAQLIAATQAATDLDRAEAVAFEEEIVAVEAELPPPATVTGYVHLHVLPSDPVLNSEPETAIDLAALEDALAEVAVSALTDEGATSVTQASAESAKPRPNRSRKARAKSAKKTQQSSIFGGPSKYIWPGDR